MPSKEIYYSDKYTDDKFEYRHVMLPKVGTNIPSMPKHGTGTGTYLPTNLPNLIKFRFEIF